jgi:[ribosomal protein S18]-alanine N-acetyltransferase
MIRIRPMMEEDLGTIRTRMRETPEAPAWSDDDLAAVVRAPADDQRRLHRGWIAGQDANIAGFAMAAALCLPGETAECELEFVFVEPPARHRGVGSMLVQTVMEWARGIKADAIRLEVRESNAAALRLYERCGFTLVGRRAGYYADPPEDALLMSRPVSD